MTTTEPGPGMVSGCVDVGTYASVRDLTEALAAPLSPEDQTVQSMPDVSPTKWHRAHTTWFFETFLLATHLDRYEPFDHGNAYLFNSYYESMGARHPRVARGLLSRPGAEEVGRYRHHVDRAMSELLERTTDPDVVDLVELGLHHEQQHQELLVMDITHVLSVHPFSPSYLPAPSPGREPSAPAAPIGPAGWIDHEGGIVEVGSSRADFSFDNEGPRHEVLLAPHQISDRLVTCGDWLEFIDADGYRRPELWMSDGWATVCSQGWEAPLYWQRVDDRWTDFGPRGRRPVRADEPVVHLSWYEADAYARFRGARLPTEAEWERAAGDPPAGAHLDLGVMSACAVGSSPDPLQFFGEAWQWTESAYRPYPGFEPAPGAVGEYNGKFMVNQQVLRGSSFATPAGHARRTYRNFFPPSARWAVAGMRLARDAR